MSPLRLLAFVFLSCFLVGDCRAQVRGTIDIDLLRRFAEDLMQCRDNAGLSIALVKDGTTVFAGGYGYRDVKKQLPVNNRTKFNIGSLTKAFTATLAADAVSKGQLKWDQPLREILGNDFRLQDDFRTQKATIRDLLAHQLGMPNYWGVTTAAMNISRADLCMKKLRYFPVDKEFRSEFEYSNYPFVLAGYVTERLRGKAWEDDVTDTLFKALGMSDTRVSRHLEPADWENIAYSYCHKWGHFHKNPEQEQLPMITRLCPAGCIFSTSEDMAKWMKFHLSGGKDESGRQVIPATALRELYRPVSAVPRQDIGPPTFPVEDTRSTYGLGFYNGQYRGLRKVYHTGSYSSYNCRMSLLPDVSLGVWACVNSPGDNRGVHTAKLVNQFALDLLLDVEPWLNGSTACTFPAPWVRSSRAHHRENYSDTGTQYPNPTYVGVYENSAFGSFTVYVKNNTVKLPFLHYKFGLLLSGRLNPSERNDKFLMTLDEPLTYRQNFNPQFEVGFPIYFSIRTDGWNVQAVSVTVPYLEFSLPPVFKKVVPGSESNAGYRACSESLLFTIILLISLLL